MKTGYSSLEIMACAASRILEDGRTAFVGTGLPLLAAALAKRTHAPNLVLIFEAGGIAPREIPMCPISVGDSMTVYKALMDASMDYVMSLAQLGYADYGFLGAAQVDVYGNINTTVIGPYDKPKVRLPGSGGANDIGSLCWRTIIMMRQDRQRFVEKLDFMTTPGYLSGPGARERAALPSSTGPYRVVTQLGVYGFDEETKRMKLLSLYPNVTVEEVKANTSFPLMIPGRVDSTAPPTVDELRILKQLDPAGVVLRRG